VEDIDDTAVLVAAALPGICVFGSELAGLPPHAALTSRATAANETMSNGFFMVKLLSSRSVDVFSKQRAGKLQFKSSNSDSA